MMTDKEKEIIKHYSKNMRRYDYKGEKLSLEFTKHPITHLGSSLILTWGDGCKKELAVGSSRNLCIDEVWEEISKLNKILSKE